LSPRNPFGAENRSTTYRQRHVLLARQQQTLRQHGRALGCLARPLRTRGQMRVRTVADQRDLVVPAHPRRDRIAVADLPVQTVLGFLNGAGDARIQRLDEPPHLVHVAGLGPRLLNVGVVLVCDDPVELAPAAQRVLHAVHVLADPDVDAFLRHKFGSHGVVLEDRAVEESPEAGVA
jgi:hypothetical protein